MHLLLHHRPDSNSNFEFKPSAAILRRIELSSPPETLAGRRIVRRYGVIPTSADVVAALAGFPEGAR